MVRAYGAPSARLFGTLRGAPRRSAPAQRRARGAPRGRVAGAAPATAAPGVAEREREGVGGIRRLRHSSRPQDARDHRLHLRSCRRDP